MTNSGAPEKKLIVAVGISKTSYDGVVRLCEEWAAERRVNPPSIARYICVTTVQGIVQSRDDAYLRRIFNEADVATPDGMPVVWAMRSFGERGQQRVYGPTLMLHLCRNAARHGHRIFLYGGRETTLPVLKAKLLERFPGLIIAGSYAPPFRPLTEEEDLAVREMIHHSDADIVFVGIGSPKQEVWMYEHRAYFPGVTMLGVGAAFDFHAGLTKQAPLWVQQSGFEWLFRLCTEPARLWRRYILLTPRFLPLWAMQLLRQR
jgi:N-acetylglucosaminyldiphosphoundecaprenol N-acetyl-beta-D-mannosaminyltransferase